MTIKQRTWELLQVAKRGDRASRRVDVFLLTLIALNIGAVIVGSVGWVETRWAATLQAFEMFSVGVFTIEYVARVYSCVADPRFSAPIIGRLRYVTRPRLSI